MWMFILIIVVLLLAIAIYEYMNNRYASRLYDEIDNDNDQAKAQEYIKASNKKMFKQPIDYYRIGSMYDHNLRNPEEARRNYLLAVITTVEDDIFAPFIRDKIRDRHIIARNPEPDDITMNIADIIREIDRIEPKAIGGDLEDRVKWVADSQNVHDSNINNEIAKSFDRIRLTNTDNYVWDMADIRDYILNIYGPSAEEKHNINGAINMIDYIQTNNSHVTKINTDQVSFLQETFSRILNESDADKKQTMMENLMLNLNESYANGTPVCIIGRITRIMSSFTDLLEEDPEAGMLKTKQAIKNEIFTKAATIREESLVNAPQVRQDYESGKDTPEVRSLQRDIKSDIVQMMAEYDLPEHDQITISAEIDACL